MIGKLLKLLDVNSETAWVAVVFCGGMGTVFFGIIPILLACAFRIIYTTLQGQ